MYGGLDQAESDAPARVLATRRRVVTIEYRLVPAAGWFSRRALGPHPNRFPAPQNDVVDVPRWLAKDSGTEIHLGGASAGANLAAATAARLRDDPEVRIASTTLAYGLFHAELPSGTRGRCEP